MLISNNHFSDPTFYSQVGRELYEKKENELDGLLASIDKYVKRRSKVHCELIRVWAVDDPHPQEDFIDSLWAQIVKLRQDKWIERQVRVCALLYRGIFAS